MDRPVESRSWESSVGVTGETLGSSSWYTHRDRVRLVCKPSAQTLLEIIKVVQHEMRVKWRRTSSWRHSQTFYTVSLEFQITLPTRTHDCKTFAIIKTIRCSIAVKLRQRIHIMFNIVYGENEIKTGSVKLPVPLKIYCWSLDLELERRALP